MGQFMGFIVRFYLKLTSSVCNNPRLQSHVDFGNLM